MFVIYAVSLPFWACGFVRPSGMKFEEFVPLWLSELHERQDLLRPVAHTSGPCRGPV